MERINRQLLGDLLAIIHRDGGHHHDKVGSQQAVDDAHEIWGRLVSYAESLAGGRCWGGSPDCPERMDNGKARHHDWCRRCEAKYWVLGHIGNKQPGGK